MGPGHLRHTTDVYPNMQLGEMAGDMDSRVEMLSSIFEKIGLSVTKPDDIHVALWEKFLLFSVASGMGAITRSTTGVWRNNTETRQMAETAVSEIVNVALSQGINLPDDSIPETMRLIDSWADGHSTSMAKDLMEGRPSELEAAIGFIVRLGSETGIDTSVNTFIRNCLLLQELEARA